MKRRELTGPGPVFVCLLYIADQERYGIWCHLDFTILSSRSPGGVRRQVALGHDPAAMAVALERAEWTPRLVATSEAEIYHLVGQPFVADVQTIDDLIIPLACVPPARDGLAQTLHDNGQPLWFTSTPPPKGGDTAG